MKTKSTIAYLKAYLPLAAILGLMLIPRTGLAASISCGQTVTNTTTTPTQIDQYSYAGTAGSTLAFSLWSAWTSAVLDIYNPAGQLVASLNGNGGAAENLTLTNSGTYTLLVHDDNYDDGGYYAFSIQSVTGGGCNSTPVTCGQTVTNSFSLATKFQAYSYAGTAGSTLAFSLWSAWTSAVLDIYNPAGQLVASLNGNGGAAENLTLTNSGTYTLLVHDDNYDDGGYYAFSIQSVTGGGCNSTPVTCGQTVTNSFSLATKFQAYSYAGTTGSTLAFSLWSAWTSAVLDIYNPAGQLVASLNGNGGAAENLTLTNSGTYTLLVHDDNYDDGGYYAFSIQSVTGGGCNSTPVTCGQTVTNSFSLATKFQAYSYAGTAGSTLAFSLWSAWTSAVLDIYNPAGQLVASLNGNGGAAENLTLTNSGTYTLLVHDDNYDDGGYYAFSIQSVTGGGCNSTPVTCGQTVTTNSIYPTEMDAYGFGTGGGTVIFTFSGSSYSGAQFDLYGPTGNKVFTGTPATAQNTNLAAGTYTLLVHDASYSGTGSYGFTITCLGGCNYSISPTGMSVGASATNGTVTVTAGAGCAWTATTNASWLRITSGSSGAGNGTVSYTVDANCSPSARVGTLTIAGFTFIVNQANPVVFVGQDIGAPGAPGSFSYTNCGTYIVSGSGEGTDGSADVFYYAYQTLAGDAQIIARLLSLQGGDPHLAEAGVMIRESSDPGSKQASLTVNASTNVIFRRRLATNNVSIQNSFRGTNYLQGPNYIWLRLMRMGNTFVAYYSTNGLNWQYMWFTTMNMSNQVQVGLAVTAHHYGQLATVTFDNVSTGGLTPLSGTWPLPGPVLLLGGQGWSPAEIQRVGGYEFLLGDVVGDYLNIKATTNLTLSISNWSTLVTVTNTYGVVPILDSGALTNRIKFYRAQKFGP